MKCQILFCLFFVATTLVATEPAKPIHIAKEFDHLQEGSRILYELPQSIVSIHVSKKTSTELVLDVASATKDILSRENLSSWLEWSELDTPAASIKERIIIELPEGRIIQKPKNPSYFWLTTLFSLDGTNIPSYERKKAGPTPMPGERDNRPVWQPRIIVGGKRIETNSSAYRIVWPDDSSFLAKREIILYFPLSPEAVKAFPYWIESPSSSYKIFVVDSKKPLP
jgi:hypothetical protein